jgi:hypothetical protein
MEAVFLEQHNKPVEFQNSQLVTSLLVLTTDVIFIFFEMFVMLLFSEFPQCCEIVLDHDADIFVSELFLLVFLI